jgi:prepilin-type N-terminal cleavage/methylation domain-containing protein
VTDEVKGWQDLATAGAVAVMAPRARPARSRARGYSLIEMLISLMVLGVLFSMGIPRFQQSLEQSRANVAVANLQAIWSAQRLYWLEYRTYAPDLPTLLTANLIDQSLTTSTVPYTYAVTDPPDNSAFTATATRGGSSVWSGAWTITQDGTLSGSLLLAGQASTITPGFQ